MKLFSLNKHAVRLSLGVVATFLAASALVQSPCQEHKKRHFYKAEVIALPPYSAPYSPPPFNF